MNRRSFLKGLASVFAASAVTPVLIKPTPAEIAWANEWLAAIEPIQAAYLQNLMIYGIAALKTTADFPFVRSVDPREIIQDDVQMAEARKNSEGYYAKSLVINPSDKAKKDFRLWQ